MNNQSLDLDVRSLTNAICKVEELEKSRNLVAAEVVRLLKCAVDAEEYLRQAKEYDHDKDIIAIREAHLAGYNLMLKSARAQGAALDEFLFAQRSALNLIIDKKIQEREASRGQADT